MTLDEMRKVDIRTVDPATLHDRRDVRIDSRQPREKRIASYLKQIGNPYCYVDDGVVVKIGFMYCIVKRNRFIFLNKDLSPQMKRIVCAHEIGHDRLHRALAKKHGLQEFVLYDMATKPEYEANIVAAEILLDSDEILEYIYDYGYTSEQIARAMHTDINLVALKIAHLAETGHKLRRMEYRSSFLK